MLWLWNTYLLLGPSFGYLIKADYDYSDQIYSSDKGHVEMTKYLSTISSALEFGFGKEIEISSSDFNMELRAQWGLTKFRVKKTENIFLNIGKWNNFGLIILIGYKFN
jgi:hypothetical protein